MRLSPVDRGAFAMTVAADDGVRITWFVVRTTGVEM
jgi:hypothetical protein